MGGCAKFGRFDHDIDCTGSQGDRSRLRLAAGDPVERDLGTGKPGKANRSAEAGDDTKAGLG